MIETAAHDDIQDDIGWRRRLFDQALAGAAGDMARALEACRKVELWIRTGDAGQLALPAPAPEPPFEAGSEDPTPRKGGSETRPAPSRGRVSDPPLRPSPTPTAAPLRQVNAWQRLEYIKETIKREWPGARLFSRGDLAAFYPAVSVFTLSADLRKLVKSGFLHRTGQKQTSRYRLTPAAAGAAAAAEPEPEPVRYEVGPPVHDPELDVYRDWCADPANHGKLSQVYKP
jgi:hypothetical protein